MSVCVSIPWRPYIFYELIDELIFESMILKNRLEEIMPTRKDEAWSKEMKSVVSEFRKGAEEYSDDEIENIVDDAVNAVRAQKDDRKERAVGA